MALSRDSGRSLWAEVISQCADNGSPCRRTTVRENRSVFSTHTRRATRPVTIGGITNKPGD
jgi:hypothetical protein